MRLIGLSRWTSAALIVASIVLSNCNTPPPATPARPIDGMCVLHADVFAANTISLYSKVFTAVRDSTSSSTGFGNFARVNGPFGDSSLSNTNVDALPSVYAISETWFRGVSFNESVRAQVIPALRTDGNGQPVPGEPGTCTSSRWQIFAQDFTGAWKTVSQPARLSAYARDQIADNNATTVAQLPQWMHIGSATPQLFFCGGTLTGDRKEQTTTLFEYTPAGTTAGATAKEFNHLATVLL
ncbi:MAG TPA: hypothetical protein VLB46_20600 [Pyrinomonadaceae bacterium]|nr:hypothetical protein [Pyrinomonadaceae bacterium]